MSNNGKNKVLGRGEKAQNRLYLIFVLPALIWVAVFIVYPFFYSIYISMTNMKLQSIIKARFIGLDNFLKLFSMEQFWNSTMTTIKFTVVVIIFQFALGFLLALLLNKTLRLTGIVRTVVMIPWVVPPIALGLTWQWIYAGGSTGLLNAVVVQLGGKPINWLGTDVALLSVIISTVWIGIPFSFMLELAGLQKIPSHLYEAASIDGADSLQKSWYVTLPMMKSTFLVNWIMITIGTLGYFDVIFALTNGGPQNVTEVLPLYMYHTAFKYFFLGRGASIAVVMLVLCLGFTFVYLKLFGSDEKGA